MALSLVVVGGGLLAAFALFPSGMDAGKRTADDVRAAEFADMVFNSYRSVVHNPTPAWDSFFPTNQPLVGSAEQPMPFPPWVWDPDGFEIINPDGKIHTNIFAVDDGSNMTWGAEDYAIRYRLDIVEDPPGAGNNGRKYIRLVTWPGQYGTNYASTNIFYTEIYKNRL